MKTGVKLSSPVKTVIACLKMNSDGGEHAAEVAESAEERKAAEAQSAEDQSSMNAALKNADVRKLWGLANSPPRASSSKVPKLQAASPMTLFSSQEVFSSQEEVGLYRTLCTCRRYTLASCRGGLCIHCMYDGSFGLLQRRPVETFPRALHVSTVLCVYACV